METEKQKVAIFADAENQANLNPWDLERRMPGYQVVEKHAFADWRNSRLNRLATTLAKHGFELHHVPSGNRPGALKNTADGHLSRGALKVLKRRPDVGTVVIVSGDAFFCLLAHQLRSQGKNVIVAAEPLCVSRELVAAANCYLPIGELTRVVQDLYHLERASEYMTFSFAVDRLGICSEDLSRLIERQYVSQDDIFEPCRGTRREIWLNRRSEVVQRILRAA